MMRRSLSFSLLALTLHSAVARADTGGADLRLNVDRAGAERAARRKQIAGGVVLALGIPTFFAGLATASMGGSLAFGCFEGCTASENSYIDSHMIGGGVAVGLGIGAIVAGTLTLGIGLNERKALKRNVALQFAPTATGAVGGARFTF